VKTQGVYQPEGSGELKGEPPTGGSGVPQAAHTIQVMQEARLSSFVKALFDAGVIPPNCKRVVIDCNTGKAIMIHYEVFGDERLNDQSVLDAVFELGVKIKTEAGK
jgi:hypothetical protein